MVSSCINRLFGRMINKVLTAVLAAGIAQAACLQAQDDVLFSSTHNASVFAQNDSSTGSSSVAGQGRRLTGIEQVAQLMRDAGLETKVLASQLASTEKRQEPWTFPVLVEISRDEKQLIVTLGLAVVDDAAQVPADTWLRLLQANQKYPTAQFALHVDRKRTEVFSLLPNRDATGLMIRDEINRLALLAQETDAIWNLNEKSSETPTAIPETPQPTTAPTKAPPSSNAVPPSAKTSVRSPAAAPASIVGRWSAARSASEAFAVEFSSDGKFTLVYVNQGKSTRSSGKYAISGNALTLTSDDGLQLSGAVQIRADAEIQVTVKSNNADLTFRRAR